MKLSNNLKTVVERYKLNWLIEKLETVCGKANTELVVAKLRKPESNWLLTFEDYDGNVFASELVYGGTEGLVEAQLNSFVVYVTIDKGATSACLQQEF